MSGTLGAAEEQTAVINPFVEAEVESLSALCLSVGPGSAALRGRLSSAPPRLHHDLLPPLSLCSLRVNTEDGCGNTELLPRSPRWFAGKENRDRGCVMSPAVNDARMEDFQVRVVRSLPGGGEAGARCVCGLFFRSDTAAAASSSSSSAKLVE